MNTYLIAIMILIIGGFIFFVLRRGGAHYYILLFVFVLTIGMVAYAFNDTIREPKRIKNPDNSTSLSCDTDFILKNETNGNQICYNESPFGHSIVTLFGMLSAVFGFAYAVEIDIKSWRMYLTPKILFYKNKYMKENRPISKHTDTYRAGDYIWAFKGYGAIVSMKENEIYVAKKDMVEQISNLLLFKGEVQKITSTALWEYIGKDERVFAQIMIDYPYNKKTHQLSEGITDPPIIFIPLPHSNQENTLFYSMKGGYGFGANRFKQVITELFKMRRAIRILDTDMTGTSTKTLGVAVTITDKAAVIGSGVSRLRQEDIKTRPGAYQPEPRQPEERRQM